jgi:hypothetical protein
MATRREDLQLGTNAAYVHGCACRECREHQRICMASNRCYQTLAAACSGLVTIRIRRSIAVSEPVCEQVVDTHVVIVDVLRHPIGKIPAPAHRGGLVVRCTAEADLGPRDLTESKVFGLNRRGELDVWGVLGACRRRPSGRCLLGVAHRLASAQQARRRPFVGSDGLGLVLQCLRYSLFLHCGAVLVGSSDHLRKGKLEVRGRTPYNASDFVDGRSCSASQLAGRSSECRDDLADDLRVTVDCR